MPWHYTNLEGLPIHLCESIPGWDYNYDLEFQRQFAIDVAYIREECGLDEKARIGVSVVVNCPAARHRKVYWSSPVPSETKELNAELKVPGSVLAEELYLESTIVLIEGGEAEDPFVPCSPGSRLYSESVRVVLEGSGSRFPVEATDFSRGLRYLVAPDALWYLDWDSSDLDAPAMRELRLFVNNRNEALLKSVQQADPVIMAIITADLARQLLAGFLDNDAGTSLSDEFAEGTIGEALTRMMRLCFPAQSFEEVRALRERDAGEFEARIQTGMALIDV